MKSDWAKRGAYEPKEAIDALCRVCEQGQVSLSEAWAIWFPLHIMELAAKGRGDDEVAEANRSLKGVLRSILMNTPHGSAYAIVLALEDGTLDLPVSVSSLADQAHTRLQFHVPESEAGAQPLTEQEGSEVFAAALTSRDNWIHAKRICATQLKSGNPLSPSLSRLSGWMLDGAEFPVQRGRPSGANIRRDCVIRCMAELLTDRFGLPVQGGFGSHNDSICSVISDVFSKCGYEMTADAVRKVVVPGRGRNTRK